MEPDDSRAVRDCEAARRAALTGRDLRALEDVLDEELVYVHSTGRIDGRASFITNVRDRVAYDAFEESGVSIVVQGALAVWSGVLSATVRVPLDAASSRVSSDVTQVFRLQGGRWRQLVFHARRRPPG